MRSGQTPDEWLMGQVARGRRDSLDVLVRRYASPLLTFIMRMTGDRHVSEELFQEVFLTVWIKRRQFDQFRRFKPWL
jgi:RNA polymerase sigma-70 factor (ECF subfamily)